MLATIKIEELTRTSFVQPMQQGYNTSHKNSGNIKSETGSNTSILMVANILILRHARLSLNQSIVTF